MSRVVEIPLTPQAQKFSVTLGASIYQMRLTYDEAGEGAWILDLGAQDGTLLLAGIPLVTGTDLFSQYAYLNLGGSLVVTTDQGAGEVPGFADLGVTSHLYFVSNA